MNTLCYSGRLKKKYSPQDVIEYIKAFSDERGISYTLLKDDGIELDFGFLTEGIVFQWEQKKLKKVITKYSPDDEEQYMPMYDMFYEMQKYFTVFELDDEYGVWYEYCYQKEPEKVTMRELTEEEEELLSHIDFNDCYSCGVVLSIIDLYIWNRGAFVEESPGTFEDMVKKIPEEMRYPGLWIVGIIELWIYETMKYKGKPVKEYSKEYKELRVAIEAAMYSIQENLVGIYCGTANKKHTILVKFFEYENEKYRRTHNGQVIRNSVESIAQVLFSSLEYLGFEICEKVQFPPKKILAARFEYWDIV